MLRKKTIQLMMGQRLQKQQQERATLDEHVKMVQRQRSVQRSRALTDSRLVPILHKQQRWIGKLQDEGRDRQADVRVAACPPNKRAERRDRERLEHWLAESDRCQRQTQLLKQEMEVLQKHTRDAERELKATWRKIRERRNECLVVRVPHEDRIAWRMESAVIRFGLQLEENRQMVDHIRHLGLEKALLVRIHGLLAKELWQMSRQILSYVDGSLSTYDLTDKVKRSIEALGDHFDKKLETFLSDMNTYNIRIDAVKKTGRFVLTKNRHRPDLEADRKLKQKEMPTPNQQDNLTYAQVMDKLRAERGQSSVEELMSTFVHLLEENYMLFRITSHNRCKVQDKQFEIAATKQKMAEYTTGNLNKEREASSTRKELQDLKELHRKEADDLGKRLQDADDVIQDYIDSVLSVLAKLDYTQDEITALAGVYGHVETRNVLDFLGEIENYVSKLCEIQNYVKYKEVQTQRRLSRRKPAEMLVKMGPRVKMLHRKWPVRLGLEDELEEVVLPPEMEGRPCSLQEMHMLVDLDLKRRQHASTSEDERTSDVASTGDSQKVEPADEEEAELARSTSPSRTDVF